MKQRFETILHFSILAFLLIALILYVAKSATDLDIKNLQKQKAALEKIEMQERVLYYKTLNDVQKDKERIYYEALKDIQKQINEEWYKK
jgi:beta-lactam-binding protein with PASTA domain